APLVLIADLLLSTVAVAPSDLSSAWVRSTPPCPASAAAHSAARARPWPATSVSGSRCSSRRTSTGFPADAARQSPRRGQHIRVVPSRSLARHSRLPRRARRSNLSLPFIRRIAHAAHGTYS